jgi:restriction system protein
MSRRRQPGKSSRQRPSETLSEKGLQAFMVAGALWVISLFLSGNPILVGAGLALRSLIWVPVAIGMGLLCLHFVLKTTRAARSGSMTRNAGGSPFGRREPQLIEPLSTSTPGSVANSQVEDATKDRPPEKAMVWSPDVFAAIEWRRFEAVVEALFAQAGFETRSQSHGADGGVDIWLYSRNAQGPVSVVQCKHWQGKPVTVKEMREFLGVMVSKGVKRGTYATTSRYTADALEFAKVHNINAQDGTGLLRLIAQRPPEQQASLLAVAYEGEYWKPTCASCGVKMTDRQSRKDGSRFWGCVNYPGCKRTLVMKSS